MIKIYRYGEVPKEEIFARVVPAMDVERIVADIIAAVRRDGDKALFFYNEKFDRAKLTALLVSRQEIDEAVALVEPEFLRILQRAAANITKFHEKQKHNSFIINDEEGIVMGQKVIPLDRAGLYVPGGTAAYPSTVLMDAIPAKIAGCREVVMVTPPNESGKINPYILAAAHVAGVDKIFKVGGAQAVAALAYGTESVPAVDKIVGPGNAFVAEAKKQVYGKVSIDMIAGPSEILIVADSTCNPKYVAADMLSQAEHDKLASSVLICSSIKKAELVRDELEKQLALLPRRDFAVQALETSGGIIVSDINHAIELANMFAPEHLELAVNNPFDYLHLIENAGSVFLGIYSPEPLGDYLAGPNHVLPTSGTARFFSPLSVDDFVKKYSFTSFKLFILNSKFIIVVVGFQRVSKFLLKIKQISLTFSRL